MNYLKNLFVDGRYYIYIGFSALIEAQRQYLLPQCNLYKQIRKSVIEELQFTQPDMDTSNLSIQRMSSQSLTHLKSLTKKRVQEIQNINGDKSSTLPITLTILALGSISYFHNPTVCAIFVGGYTTLLAVDFAKSISVIKFGMKPMWTWKMKDMGYIMACCFVGLTFVGITKSAITRLKNRSSKSLILRKQAQDLADKKQ